MSETLEDSGEAGYLIDTVTREVRGNRPITLSPREMKVFRLLSNGKVLTPKRLFQERRHDMQGSERAYLGLMIHRIRVKLSYSGVDWEIHTVWGDGYLLRRIDHTKVSS